jgi:hypothetical protein
MNERIKQLAEQARINVSQKNYGYYWVESADGIEKFAELIVRECTNRVNQYINDCGEVSSLPDYVLESHFGVEE